METKPVRFFSNSRVEADERCHRERYLGSEWGGTGLEPVMAGWDLKFGNIIHSWLKVLAIDGDIDFIAVRVQTLAAAEEVGLSDAREWAALAEGLLRGFVKTVWHRWMKEYDIIEAERLRKWEVEQGYVFRFIQDLLVKNKFDESITYIDYKTTSSDDPKWIASWAKSPQLHSSMHSLIKLRIPVQGVIVQGLFKGWKDKKTHKQTSIMTRGWVNREYAMSPQYSYTYQKSKGWEVFSTYDEFDNLESWVANMPIEILSAQYPQTAPIFPRADMAEKYFRQQLIREKEVDKAMEALANPINNDIGIINNILDEHFKQNFSHCQPAWGYSCQFKDLCWTQWIEADPLGSGQFRRREELMDSFGE